jgi:hypothetical protein
VILLLWQDFCPENIHVAITREHGCRILEPHYPRLFRCIVDLGFERYRRYPNRVVHRPGTRASVVHDLMINGAQQVFDGVGGIRFVPVAGTDITLLEIDETVLIWFKKLRSGRNASGNRTRNSKTMMRGDVADLPGIPAAATLLVAGYYLNRDQTRVARVSIVKYTSGGQVEWYIDLDEPGDNVLPMREPDLNPPGETSRRVRVKLSEVQDKLIK